MAYPMKCAYCGAILYGATITPRFCPKCNRPWKEAVNNPIRKGNNNPIEESIAAVKPFIEGKIGIPLGKVGVTTMPSEVRYVAVRRQSTYPSVDIYTHPIFFPDKPSHQRTVLAHELAEEAFCRKMRGAGKKVSWEPHAEAEKFTEMYQKELGLASKEEVRKGILEKGPYFSKNPTLVMPIKSRKQIEHLFKAQEQLAKAGVTFDTGTKMTRPMERHWELDWSLKGASMRNPIVGQSKMIVDYNKEVTRARKVYTDILRKTGSHKDAFDAENAIVTAAQKKYETVTREHKLNLKGGKMKNPFRSTKTGKGTSKELTVYLFGPEGEEFDSNHIGFLVNGRTGKATNRWGDGTVGIPKGVIPFIEEVDTAYDPYTGEEYEWQHKKSARFLKNPKRKLSVFDKHQLAIAKKTLTYSDVGAKIMGGPTKVEAREIIKRLTGRTPRENPRKRNTSVYVPPQGAETGFQVSASDISNFNPKDRKIRIVKYPRVPKHNPKAMTTQRAGNILGIGGLLGLGLFVGVIIWAYRRQ